MAEDPSNAGTSARAARVHDPSTFRLSGRGLHTGQPCAVELRPRSGPVAWSQVVGPSCAVAGPVATDALAVVDTTRAVTVATHSTGVPGARLRIGTVDHLWAALTAHRVFFGIDVRVTGPELPLLDGGARDFSRSVRAFFGGTLPAPLPVGPAAADGQAARSPRAHGVGPLRVRRTATLRDGGATIHFAPSDRVDVAVTFETDDPRIAPDASWEGDPDDFFERIAPARTFTFADDISLLLESRLARGVDPLAVVVIAPECVYSAGAPFSADEPARHKLLDLLGDLYPYGGAPLGRIHAERPGHRTNHVLLRRALREGIVGR